MAKTESKMRVCPKCGHHDPWYWRGSGVYTGLEFCRFSDFQEDYPEIADALLKAKRTFGTKNFVFNKDYRYHLTKGMNVERQAIIENPMHDSHWKIPPVEAPAHGKQRSGYGLNPAHHDKKLKVYDPHPKQKKLA